MQGNKDIKEINMDYHERQFDNPYRSTIAFSKFLNKNVNIIEEKILDLACGAGANLSYFGGQYPSAEFTGIDISESLIKAYRGKDNGNIRLEQGDWYNLDRKYVDYFDGIISLQTLSWLPEYKEPLKKVCELNPKWIAISSLFYEGKINYTINVENYESPTIDSPYSHCYYNIYAMPLIKEFLRGYGYNKFVYEPFEIDIDIDKPDHYDLGTYTIKTDDNKRLQISAGLMLPWYFIFASKL